MNSMTKAKKISILLILATVLAFIIVGALRNEQQNIHEQAGEPGNLQVSATIFPIYDIAKQVGRDLVRVDLILPAGASPHTFDPSPRTVQALSGSEVVLAIGHDIDGWVSDLAKGAGDIPVRTVDTNIELRDFGANAHHDEGDEHHDDENHEEDTHGHDHEGLDPHYWLSPVRAMQIANNMVEIFAALDPANTRTYQANAREFRQDIEEQLRNWRRDIAQIEDPEIITFHDAFGYFAEDLGVEIVATVEPFAGQEATAQYLRELTEVVADTGVSALFLEPQLSSRNIEAFARDNNLSLGVLDPLGGVSGRESYIDLISYNVEQITAAFR